MTTQLRKQLSIAILGTRGLPARYGGFESFAEEISGRLSQRGVSVTVFCPGEGDPKVYREGVSLEYVTQPALGPLSTIVYDINSLIACGRRFDIVYMLGYGTSFACIWPRILGVPVWINMDGLEWKRSKWSLAGRLYLRVMEWLATKVASHLVADAQGIAQHVRTLSQTIPCTVLPYGAVIPDTSTLGPPPFGLRAGGYHLIVARLEPENHIVEMIEGHLLARSKRPLVVVGGATSERYAARCFRYVNPDVRFLGPIHDRDELMRLRFHARSYLHGHSVGGTNPSLLEAMACGNLVLAHANQFNREVAGASALYFDSPSAVAEGLRALDEWPDDECQHRRRAVIDRVRANYAWDTIADGYAALAAQHCKVRA